MQTLDLRDLDVSVITHQEKDISCAVIGCPGEKARWMVKCKHCDFLVAMGQDCYEFYHRNWNHLRPLFTIYSDIHLKCNGCGFHTKDLNELVEFFPI